MKSSKLTALCLLCAAVFLLTACSGGATSAQSSTPAPVSASAAATSAAPSSAPANSVTVTMKNFKFDPAEVTINKGQTVTWVNKDGAAHDVVGAAFKSGSIPGGQSFSTTFNEAGTFDYSCTFHAGMTGKVIVK